MKSCENLHNTVGVIKNAPSAVNFTELKMSEKLISKKILLFFLIDYDISIYVFDVRTLKQPNN
jgi:hypothetical protein